MTLIFNRTIDHLIQLPLFYQILCLVTVWFASITNLNMILWRCEERPWSFGKYKIALSSLNIIITIWFVVILLWGWQGRVYSQCIAIIVFGAISLWILIRREYFVLKISKQDMLHVLFFALPLLPHALSFGSKAELIKFIWPTCVRYQKMGCIPWRWHGEEPYPCSFSPLIMHMLPTCIRNYRSGRPNRTIRPIRTRSGWSRWHIFVY